MSKFKVGDWVRSVLDTDIDIDVGDVFTVTGVCGDTINFKDRAGDERTRFEDDYELAAPFKVGDRVFLTKDNGRFGAKGDCGEVVAVIGTTCDVKLDRGNTWFIDADRLALVDSDAWDAAPSASPATSDSSEPRFKVGDRVRVIHGYMAAAKGAEAVVREVNDRMLDVAWIRDGRDNGQMDGGYFATSFEPAPLRIEAGRYYKTRDGRKVGPVGAWNDKFSCRVKPTRECPVEVAVWEKDGKNSEHCLDLTAEWVDEPTATTATAPTTASNDNVPVAEQAPPVAEQPAEPKFKVGDRVKILHTDYPEDIPEGSIQIISSTYEDGFEINTKECGELYFYNEEGELADIEDKEHDELIVTVSADTSALDAEIDRILLRVDTLRRKLQEVGIDAKFDLKSAA